MLNLVLLRYGFILTNVSRTQLYIVARSAIEEKHIGKMIDGRHWKRASSVYQNFCRLAWRRLALAVIDGEVPVIKERACAYLETFVQV